MGSKEIRKRRIFYVRFTGLETNYFLLFPLLKATKEGALFGEVLVRFTLSKDKESLPSHKLTVGDPVGSLNVTLFYRQQ